jgi:Putative amidoligase enzyme
MPTLNQLRDQWNLLVPIAHRAGIWNVHSIRSVHESISHGQRRVSDLVRRIELRIHRLPEEDHSLLQAVTGMLPQPQDRLQQLATEATRRSEVQAISGAEDFTFGVEVEFMLPVGMARDAMAALIREAGVPCETEMYNHSARHHWKLVTDGSLADYNRGSEAVSPVLRGVAGLEQLARVLDVIRLNGGKVSLEYFAHLGLLERRARGRVTWFRAPRELYEFLCTQPGFSQEVHDQELAWIADGTRPAPRGGTHGS